MPRRGRRPATHGARAPRHPGQRVGPRLPRAPAGPRPRRRGAPDRARNANRLPEGIDARCRSGRLRSEPILALDPDLVIADETQSPETRTSLRAYGVPVLLLEPHGDLDAGIHNLRLLAAPGDRRRGGRRRPEARRRALRDRLDPEARPSVLQVSWFQDGPWCAGTGTGEDWAIALAGGRNHAATLGLEGYRALPIELLLAQPPDVLVLSSRDELERLADHERLGELAVLRNGRALVLPKDLSSADSPFRLDAAELLRAGLVQLGLVKE
ncbi:MAG: ABC transporter substrate-binding protein [Planctomycetota bacterium]